jgi:large subunit ribosomal protein L9
MKLILVENIRGLGSTGDEVKVRDGYARNYLLPRKLAVYPTADNAQRFRKERDSYLVREKGHIDSARLIAEKLKDLTLTLKMKANDAGHLFGSVTEAIVAENLSTATGMPIEPKQIILGSHYKNIGDYEATVRLHSEVEVEIALSVQAEQVLEDAVAQELARSAAEAEAEVEAKKAEKAEKAEKSDKPEKAEKAEKAEKKK